MQSAGRAFVTPRGAHRVVLTGDELTITLISYHDGHVRVRYPDGYERMHQVLTVLELLDKVSGQLRTRYNVESFEIKAIPEGLSHGQITLTGVTYA